ncbi:cyclic-di-AMP phosphodiesterase PgpH [Compostibacillus humi]|uniref:Cyclic-di-AMP phosphodiesterase PgpH n=1 Tax=Compostibacillus humi TaxID=1245525 RepID=A0A8J2TNL7_9BACI|nr:HDIG domain-containing metalloprotein [Compostibacillus humi]GFZ81921.1 cyclic-di-AMP phosphodiesterase PgpH [Compostibacillus humi]
MKKNQENWLNKLWELGNTWGIIVLSASLLGLFFFFLTINNVFTQTYEIEKFSIASETIRSPITIENKQETERRIRESVQAVEDRYAISQEITEERINYIHEIFDAISTLEEEYSVERKDEDIAVPITEQEKVNRLKQILSEDITSSVSDQTLIQLLQVPKKDREKGRTFFLKAVEETLNDGVRTENLQTSLAQVKDNIKYSELSEDLKSPLSKLTEFAIVENSFFDVELTSEARKEAASNVNPVMIQAGEIIVREGQVITNDIYAKLELVGVLDQQANLFPIIGLVLLILLLCLVIAHEMRVLLLKGKLDQRKMMAIVFVSIIVASMMKVISLYTTTDNYLFYVTPISMGVLLVKLLIHERFSFIFASVMSILASVIFNGEIPGQLNIEAGIYCFISQIAAIILLKNTKDRSYFLKAGFGITIVNLTVITLFIFLSFEKYTYMDLLFQGAFGVVSAFLASVLTIGLLPFFETGLGILTDGKLLQLSNPNQPLLKKILTEAPGTYHHSIMVANLSETACEAIGANGLLARVGSYYHDIGKTVRPHYFIENQLSIQNPHDFIEPEESAKIIISHPYDGAEILMKEKMPNEIIDIAKQHHGTTLLKYFYFKAKETDQFVEEKDYRYPGPKPQTKEAAIICICDSVEAAVRSLKEPTEEKIEEIVSLIIKDRMTDGQMNECPLTLKELETIQETICNTLKGIFHSRIQYPTKEAK